MGISEGISEGISKGTPKRIPKVSPTGLQRPRPRDKVPARTP
jgi:hypothetical protein